MKSEAFALKSLGESDVIFTFSRGPFALKAAGPEYKLNG